MQKKPSRRIVKSLLREEERFKDKSDEPLFVVDEDPEENDKMDGSVKSQRVVAPFNI